MQSVWTPSFLSAFCKYLLVLGNPERCFADLRVCHTLTKPAYFLSTARANIRVSLVCLASVVGLSQEHIYCGNNRRRTGELLTKDWRDACCGARCR
jgi:hypothetical protein